MDNHSGNRCYKNPDRVTKDRGNVAEAECQDIDSPICLIAEVDNDDYEHYWTTLVEQHVTPPEGEDPLRRVVL